MDTATWNHTYGYDNTYDIPVCCDFCDMVVLMSVRGAIPSRWEYDSGKKKCHLCVEKQRTGSVEVEAQGDV